MSRPDDRDPILPPSAPPPYSEPPAYNPGGAMPNEPPPKYEPPKEGYNVPQPPPCPPGGYQSCQPNVVMITAHYGPNSQQMQCPYCLAYITTSTDYQAGGLTWLSAGLICLFGCWIGCCLVPFCIGDLQDVQHKCPTCHRVLGTYRRLD